MRGKQILAAMSLYGLIVLPAIAVTWYQSGYDASNQGLKGWSQQTVEMTKADASHFRVINLDKVVKRQRITGFGAAFNEKEWEVMSALKPAQRQQLMRSMFDKKAGLGLTIGRLPIGANDFAMDYYSYDDHPGDYQMKYFSIDRDKRYLLPMAKAALKIAPDMSFFASPWTPPAWMKVNGFYGCIGSRSDAHLRWDNQTQQAYADYLALYVNAMQQQGIPVTALHLQNEPMACQDFPSSLWNGQQMHDFLKNYLVPEFKQQKINATIWLGTINDGDYEAYAKPVFGDKQLAPKLAGIGYQWDGKYAIADTHQAYPQVRLMQTESECGDGSNDLAAGFYTFSLMKTYLDAGAESYIYWNMVLDSSGMSSWGWRQNSLVSIDRRAQQISYHFDYYVMKHVSQLVKRGAHLIEPKGFSEQVLAFVNPDGQKVVVVANPSYTAETVRIEQNGQMLKATLPQQTINSFVF